MAKYSVTFKKSVARELRGIPNQDVRRILNQIDVLANTPREEGCIKLSGQECYRVRQGPYRIIYEILDDRLVVSIVKVGHRSSVYQSK